MLNNNFLKNIGAGTQLIFLFLNFLLGLFVTVFLTLIISKVMGLSNFGADNLSFQRFSQFISTIFTFIIPALFCAFLFNAQPKSFLKIDSFSKPYIYIFTFVLIIASQPLMAAISEWNTSIIPESMTWIAEMEKAANALIGKFMADKTILGIALNLFIIAIMAGLAEELFFRGALQTLLSRITKNKHLGIWITAIIFSTIHFQFNGFFPRMLLGAAFGYLLVWSGSLWIPIFAHTIHNALNVIVMQYYYGTPKFDELENIDMSEYWWLVLLSVVASFALMFMLWKNRQKELPLPTENIEQLDS